MPNPQEVLEYLESQKKKPETPEAPRRIPIDPQLNHIVITAEAYEALIRTSERFKLIENYVMNNEYYGTETLRAMVGYTGEE